MTTQTTTTTITDFDRYVALSHFDEEMAKEHTPTEDLIHNWLCDNQQDDELIAGILAHLDRDIKGAVAYCSSKAADLAYKHGNLAMVDDATVFSWIREYFVKDEIETKPVSGTMTKGASSKPKPKKRAAKKTSKPKGTAKSSSSESDSTATSTVDSMSEAPAKVAPKAAEKQQVNKQVPQEEQMDLFADFFTEEGEL